MKAVAYYASADGSLLAFDTNPPPMDDEKFGAFLDEMRRFLGVEASVLVVDRRNIKQNLAEYGENHGSEIS